MLKQLMLARQLTKLQEEMRTFVEQEETLKTREAELEAAIGEAETDEEIEAVEAEVESFKGEEEELVEKKGKLQEEIERIEGELEELKSKVPDNKRAEERADKVDKQELRNAINNFIRSKGQRRDDDGIEGFKVVDGGALVPEEFLKPEHAVEDIVDLKKYVHVIPAKRGSGTYPVISKSGSKLSSVAELEQNPELAKPTMEDIEYKIATYRGYVPISQEVIDDADYDIVGLIRDEINEQGLNTDNHKIATVLKTATAKTVEGLDELITLLNTGFKMAYNVKLYISQSLFNELDLLKDARGRYLLQDDVKVASGKRLKGKEVVVLDDDMIGTKAGDLVGFVGDAKAFAKYFDRKQTTAGWINHEIYGQLLGIFKRFDVVKADAKAGYYIKWTDEPGLEILDVGTVAGSEAEGDTVLTVIGDEGGQLAYKIGDTHTIVTYGKKAVGFKHITLGEGDDISEGVTLNLTKADNDKVITVVELDIHNNVTRVGSGALATKQ